MGTTCWSQIQVVNSNSNLDLAVLAAGPNWTDDEKSWEGDGLVVIRAKSLAEATDIMKRDPMHKALRGNSKYGLGSSMRVRYP